MPPPAAVARHTPCHMAMLLDAAARWARCRAAEFFILRLRYGVVTCLRQQRFSPPCWLRFKEHVDIIAVFC